MPKVSVIIPVYNTEQYLRECLDSVVNQTLKDIEIICANDGSTDNSGRILEEYAEKDSRIKVIHKENTGSANSRNVGIEIATGEYLGFIDSDDYISKNYFQELYKSALKNDADIAMTTGLITWKNKKKSKKTCGVNKKQNLITSQKEKSEIIITTGVSCNKIYKKTFLQDNNINYLGIHSAAEDNYFTDIAIIKANKISVIHNAIYNYVLRNQSLSQHLKNEKDFNCIDVYNKIEEYIIKNIASEEDAKIWLETIRKRKQNDYTYHIDSMEPNCVDKFLTAIKASLGKKLVLSLTSYPARINTVHRTIETLLNQSLKADSVILWLAKEQFPNKEKDLPTSLIELTQRGLTISWCEDIKSYKKLIPALKQFPNDIIITADDDIIYHRDTIKNLYLTYLKNDNCLICHRAHYITFRGNKINPYKKWITEIQGCKKASFNIFFTGCGTVLYPPNCLFKDILNRELFEKLAKNSDDIWFWAMAILNNTKIKLADKPFYKMDYVAGTQNNALFIENCDLGNNDRNIKLVLNYYPQILTKLKKDNDLYKNNLEKIFSVRNNIKTCHKVITICGLQIKLKSKKLQQKKQIKDLEKRLLRQEESFRQYRQENQLNKLETCYKNMLEKTTPHPELKNLSVDIVSHCNLNCQCCDHFSPLAEKSFENLDIFEKDINRLSEISNATLGVLKLMGGEPLLHPQLMDFMSVARKAFPNTRIEIVTNAIILNIQPEEFWQACNKYNIVIVPTKYPLNTDYEKAEQIARSHNVKLEYYGNTNEVLKTSYHSPLDIKGKQNAVINFLNCYHANNCIFLKKGKLYTCTVAPNIERFNKYFNKNLPLTDRDGIDIYKVQTIDEILEFLAKPIPFCKYCNISGRTFGHKWGISKKRIEEWT